MVFELDGIYEEFSFCFSTFLSSGFKNASLSFSEVKLACIMHIMYTYV